jgi:hypothetical protein
VPTCREEATRRITVVADGLLKRGLDKERIDDDDRVSNASNSK